MTGSSIVSGSAKHISKTASSGGLSPSRSPPSTARQRMPSPRTSPAIRPQSPLSPRYDTSGRFEPLQPPSPRAMHSRTAGNTQRRANTNSLKLPSLPRFHPANYPSAHNSVQTTPDAGSMGSPQPPASPRSHQRTISEAQKHLLAYQRETISAARASSPIQMDNPQSPRLAPLGSPGPVTPLELEADDSYLIAGARNAGNGAVSSEELVEKLIKEEAARQRRTNNNSSLSRPSSR